MTIHGPIHSKGLQRQCQLHEAAERQLAEAVEVVRELISCAEAVGAAFDPHALRASRAFIQKVEAGK